MLRYVKDHMATIGGVEIYPIISLLIFFLFFLALAWYVFKVDKRFISYMKSRPLELEGEDEAEKDIF